MEKDLVEMSEYKNYWDYNIGRWSDLYLNISHGHEDLKGSRLLKYIYNHTLIHYEAHLMKERFKLTQKFLTGALNKDMILNDIGCGTGIFSVQALNHGAKVNAIDISEVSLDITKKNIQTHASKCQSHVNYFLLDAQLDKLPHSDISLCVGVAPYIINFESFLGNILRNTTTVFFQYVDAKHFINKIRQHFKFLNVRNLTFHDDILINKICEDNKFVIQSCSNFGTGKILIMSKEE